MKRPLSIGIFPIVVLVIAALIGGYQFGSRRGEDRAEKAHRAITFTGAVASIDSDEKSACVRPERNYKVPDSSPDGACGLLFWTLDSPPRVGDRVRVTLVRGTDQFDADIRSLLLSKP